jgi:TolB-like protein/Tfp pilus assembly protein PilF
MSLFNELARRNVIRVAIAYLAGSWLTIQVLETLFPIFGLAETSIRALVIVLAIGFVPTVILSWVFQLTPDGLRLDADVDRSAPSPYGKVLDRTIIVLLTLAVGYFSVDKFVFDPARDAAEIEAAREEGRAGAIVDAYGDKSIIVLPFVNMSDDRNQEYFSDGLTEELLNLLAKIRELRVISRSTAFTFKGEDIGITEVAKKVNVGHVLEGSVRKSGNTIRVTAQLIDARTDTHLWSETYDRELDDVFAIQDDISSRVVEELKVRMLGQTLQARRVDPEAYDLFLQARFILNSLDDDRVYQAESLLLRALEIAPNYPAAISELARVYFPLSRDFQEDFEPFRQKRDQQIERLVELAPDSAEANGWLATVNFWEGGDKQAAAKYMEAALAANPTDSRILQTVAFFLGDLGRTEEAVAVGKYIVRRDPACSTCLASLAWAYRLSGKHAEAVETLESILAWRPPDDNFRWQYGVALLFSGRPEEALVWFEPGAETGMGVGYLAALYDAGRQAEFERKLSEIDASDPNQWDGLARVYAWIGDNDKAFEFIDKMVERSPDRAGTFDTDFYARLEGDPRWTEFRARHGYDERSAEHVVFNPVLPEEIMRTLGE